jgi:hypothetical protein
MQRDNTMDYKNEISIETFKKINMKRINLCIVFSIVSINFIFAQNKQLIGKYYFRHSTNDYDEDYEMISEIDSKGNISFRRGNPKPDDGCCTQTATLEIKSDFTFFMSYLNDQGDYQTKSEICGIYTVKGDTLTMYSPFSPKIKNLEKEPKNISKNLFKVSFKNSGWTMGYLYSFLNNYEFYSLDKNYLQKRIMPLYTIPDKNKVDKTRGYDDIDVGFKVTDIDTISFVFNRKDIEDYFYYFYRNPDNESVRIFNEGLLLKMLNYKYNYFQDFDRINFYPYPACEGGINDFSFIIGDSVLKSIHQTSNETGRKYYYEFIRKEDKR